LAVIFSQVEKPSAGAAYLPRFSRTGGRCYGITSNKKLKIVAVQIPFLLLL